MASVAERQTGRSDEIRTPDQLQQERRPDPRPAPPDAAPEPRAAARPGGVLGQLETERAHD